MMRNQVDLRGIWIMLILVNLKEQPWWMLFINISQSVRRLHQLNSIPEEVQKINFPRTQSNDVSDIWTAMETNGPWDKQTLKIIADILDSSELCIGLDVNDFANIYEIIDSLMDEKSRCNRNTLPMAKRS